MNELQNYATHKHIEREDGLPIVKFERRPEGQIIDMSKASAKGSIKGGSSQISQPLNQLKRMAR